MKKPILTVAILALSTASFAGEPLPTNTVDCGASSTCMPDQTLNQGDNTSTKTAQQDLNGNAVTISPVLTDENINKNNITGGNTTSTGGTNTATGGTYTTGALNAGGATVGNTDNASSATTGASSSSTGAITLTPTNTQGLTDASTRNTQQQQSLTGGAVTVTPTSNQNAAANNSAKTGSNTSTTNVDAADRSSTVYQSLAYELPDMPAVVATNLATAQMTKTAGVCGPLVNIRRDKVTGMYQGLVFKSRIDQGHDDNVETFVDNDGNEQLFKVVNVAGRQMLSGHQLHITSAVISLGGARQIGIGGGSVSSDYGQASAGSSSQTQRLVTNVQAVPCVVGVLEAAPVNRIKG